jgi:hypothetical protein
MPHKFNDANRDKFEKARYRVTNASEYESTTKRGAKLNLKKPWSKIGGKKAVPERERVNIQPNCPTLFGTLQLDDAGTPAERFSACVASIR